MLIDPARITVSCFDGDIIAGSHSKGLNFDTIVRNTQVTTSWNNGSVENFLLKQGSTTKVDIAQSSEISEASIDGLQTEQDITEASSKTNFFLMRLKKMLFPVPPGASTRNILGHHGIDLFSAIREVFPNYFKTSSKILLCSSLSKE